MPHDKLANTCSFQGICGEKSRIELSIKQRQGLGCPDNDLYYIILEQFCLLEIQCEPHM